MPINHPQQKEILQNVIEILDARVRYNRAFQEEILSIDKTEDLFDYFSNISGVFRDTISMARKKYPQGSELEKNLVNQLKNSYAIDAINDDIKLLEFIKKCTEGFAETGSDSMFMSLVYNLYIALKHNELTLKKQADMIKHMSAAALSNPPLIPASDSTEYFTYVEIYKSIENLFGPIEKEFIDTYTELFIYKETGGFRLNDNFQKLINDTSLELKSITDKIEIEAKDFKNEFNIDICPEIAYYSEGCKEALDQAKLYFDIQKSIKIEDENATTQAEMICRYYNAYSVKQKIQEFAESLKLIQHIKAYSRTEQSKEQEIIATQRALEESRRQEQDRLAAKQITEQAKAEKQKAAKAAEEARIKENNAKIKSNIELQLAQRKADTEAKRTQREKDKTELRTNLAKDKVVTTNNGKVKSTFKLSDDIIAKNSVQLSQIVNRKIEAITFEDATTLIKRLGGTVEPNKGSHHKIMFNDSVYSYVAGLPRPHGGNTDLRRFELSLFRDILTTILTPEWIQKLTTPSSTKQRVQP